MQLFIAPDQIDLEFENFNPVEKKNTPNIKVISTCLAIVAHTDVKCARRFLEAPSSTKSNSSVFAQRGKEGRASVFMIQ